MKRAECFGGRIAGRTEIDQSIGHDFCVMFDV